MGFYIFGIIVIVVMFSIMFFYLIIGIIGFILAMLDKS